MSKKQVSTSLIILNFNEIASTLQNDPKNTTALEKAIVMGYENLTNIEDLKDIDINIIKLAFDHLSKFILNNFSSSKLSLVINFISLVLQKLNYHGNISTSEIRSLIDMESKESQIERLETEVEDPKDIKSDDFVSEKSIISNQFLSAFYALIVTISNKPEIIIKSKNLLKSVVVVLSQIADIDNIAIYYKKKRLINVFGKILNELAKSDQSEVIESLMVISKLYLYIFAKIGKKKGKISKYKLKKSAIYRDYMFKKAIPDLMSSIFVKFFSTNLEYLEPFCIYIMYSIRVSNHKTFFWTKGVVSILMENLDKMILSKNENESLIEIVLLTLLELTKDCCK